MLNMRTADGRSYNPSRDIVQLFPRVIAYQAMIRLAILNMPPALRKFATESGVTAPDVASAGEALAKFVSLSVHHVSDDLPTLWEQSGMGRLKPAVLLAVMATIGEATLAVFYKTVRAATQAGRGVPGADHLAQVAEMAGQAIKTDLPSSAAKRLIEAEGAALPSLIENTPR